LATHLTGRLAENVVAIMLEKRRLQGRLNYFFWKNSAQEEVDFVLMENCSVSRLIQVCWNLDNSKTANRELRALLKAGNELNCKELLVLSERKESKEDVEWSGIKGRVEYIPVWKWLL
jgi:predicted AAA+ superfamily ATPase